MAVLERVCFNLCIVCIGNSQEVENIMRHDQEYWIKMRRQIHARIIRRMKELKRNNDAKDFKRNNEIERRQIESEINYLKKVKEGLR